MDLLNAVIGFSAAGVTTVLTGIAVDWVQAWQCYLQSGEYNYDNDTSTPDACQGFNPATGKWFDIEIREYQKPYFPGTGGVVFYTVDKDGVEHRNFHPWKTWVANRHNRRAK